jgi:hypothetical protein
MKTSLGLLALLLLPLVPACEKVESHPLTVADKSAEEAADLTTDLACDYAARCGMIEVSCADCASGEDCGGCYVEQTELTVEDCEAEISSDVLAGFSCQPLTEDEEARVDECLAVLNSAECPSVEEVDDWANGGGGEDPRPEALAACDVLEEIMSRCYEPGESSEPAPAEPMPG